MRILLTIHHPLDADTGAPGITLALRDAYRAAGEQADILSFDDLPARLPQQAKELLFPLFVAARLALRERPDVVDASAGDTYIWGRLRRVLRRPGVLACRAHGLAHTFWEAEAREAAEAGRALSRRSRLYHGNLRLRQDATDLRGADLCILYSAGDRERAIDELGVAQERAHVVINGVPGALIGRPPPAPPAGPVRIAHIGSYAPRKGVRQLASALAPLLEARPRLSVTFLGTRASAPTVWADYPPAVRDRVRVVEQYDRASLPELLDGHQLYVSASLAEGLSLALLEAMACGLAPLVTDIPGTRAVLSPPDDGVLVAPGDPPALGRALEQLLDDPERLQRVRRAAHATAQRFAWERVAEQQLELYRGVGLPASSRTAASSRVRPRVRRLAQRGLLAMEARTGFRLTRAPSKTAPERSHPDLADPAFGALCRRCGPFTMTSIERMYALHQAVGHVDRAGIPGDVVECGVWRGGSAMLAALRLLELGDGERRLWLYDTFAGMPEPGEHDADPSGARMVDEWDRHRGRTDDAVFSHASLEDVQANMATTSFPPERMRYIRGRVEETIPAAAPERIALLRLDTDWYESTRHELEHLYPRLAPGGVLIIDDYGHWQGARKAVDEWLAGCDSPPLLNRIDETGRIAVKPA